MIEIPLGRPGVFATVDDCDARWARLKWHASGDGPIYAICNLRDETGRHIVRLHRVILGAPKGVEVDHINGDGLDCRRENLRLATHLQNGKNRRPSVNNTSGFKGVCRNRRNVRKVWRAEIWTGGRRNGRHIFLGCFETAEAAARAYDEAAIRLHGRFARLNFPGVAT